MLDKKISIMLIKAQMCSDSGKGYQDTYAHPEWKRRADKFGYDHKVEFIIKIMDRISQLKGKSGFSYYVGGDDFSDIVYFNFKYYGERYQISFHVPEGIPAKYKKNNSSHYTKWKGCGSSIEATYVLSKILEERKEEK